MSIATAKIGAAKHKFAMAWQDMDWYGDPKRSKGTVRLNVAKQGNGRAKCRKAMAQYRAVPRRKTKQCNGVERQVEAGQYEATA